MVQQPGKHVAEHTPNHGKVNTGTALTAEVPRPILNS